MISVLVSPPTDDSTVNFYCKSQETFYDNDNNQGGLTPSTMPGTGRSILCRSQAPQQGTTDILGVWLPETVSVAGTSTKTNFLTTQS